MQAVPVPAGRLWGTLVLAAGTVAAGPAQADFDRRSLIELGGSVLRIESQEDSGRMQVGSGVVIAKERVVTNCHVTRRAKSITVVQAGSRWPVQAQTVDAEHDLCLLQVPELPHKPVALGKAGSLREGQDLAALGYTGGPALRISGGSVVALHQWDGSQVIQCSNGFSSGASGGGLFDEQGRLVGILTFRLPGGRSNYYAMPVEWLPAAEQAQARAVDVKPHDGQGFWQGPVNTLPNFLQAAAMESAGQWDALLQLTERWMREDAADAEPLYLRALANANLGRDEAASQTWQRSLTVNPGFSRSWAALAELYHRSGQAQQEQQALASLNRLNPALARETTEKLGTDAPLPAQHAAAAP
ncbi:S1 family peptidase [Azohydromonas lata]|uniref:S1 family peptidase n=1 Tax=Azohydromonas lata TaxID=45677 RepID=UPI00083624B5|nr:serine protease [Azohydromonas lata]